MARASGTVLNLEQFEAVNSRLIATLKAERSAERQADREEQEQKFAALRAQVEAVQAQNEALQAQNAAMQAQNEAMRAEAQTMQATMQATISSMQAAITSMQAKLNAAEHPMQPPPPLHTTTAWTHPDAGPSTRPPGTPAAATPPQLSGAHTPNTTGAATPHMHAPPNTAVPLSELVERRMRACNFKVWLKQGTAHTPDTLMNELNTVHGLRLTAEARLLEGLPQNYIVSCRKVANGERGVNSLYIVTCVSEEVCNVVMEAQGFIKKAIDYMLTPDLTHVQAKVKDSYHPVCEQLRGIGVGVARWAAEHPVFLLPDGTYRAVYSVEDARALLTSVPPGKPLKSRPPPNYQKRSREQGADDTDAARTAAPSQEGSGENE